MVEATSDETIGVGERLARRTDSWGILLRRAIGAWIDFIAVALLLFAPALAAPIGETTKTAGIFVGVALALAYFPVTEGLWGRSLGKLATGTIVVDAAGRPPGVLRAIVRTLLRLIEVNPFLIGGLPAGLLVLLTGARQRLGDLAAGTFVVQLKELDAARSQSPPLAVFD